MVGDFLESREERDACTLQQGDGARHDVAEFGRGVGQDLKGNPHAGVLLALFVLHIHGVEFHDLDAAVHIVHHLEDGVLVVLGDFKDGGHHQPEVLFILLILEKEEIEQEINLNDTIITDNSIFEYLKTLGINAVKYEDKQEKMNSK